MRRSWRIGEYRQMKDRELEEKGKLLKEQVLGRLDLSRDMSDEEVSNSEVSQLAFTGRAVLSSE